MLPAAEVGGVSSRPFLPPRIFRVNLDIGASGTCWKVVLRPRPPPFTFDEPM